MIVDTSGHQQTPIERQEAEKQAAKAKAEKQYHRQLDRWMLRWTGITAIATAGLIFVGFGGVYAAIHTLRAIEKQAAMQAASMTQAVTPDNWRVEIIQWHESNAGRPKTLRVRFDIVDESSFPLSVNGTFRFCGHLPNATILTIAQGFASPMKPYTSTLLLYPTEEQAIEYAKGILRIAVTGEYTHTGVLGKQGPLMGIVGNLCCGNVVPSPFMEHESIRLIPTHPMPRPGLPYYLGLYWKSRKHKGGDEPS